MIVRVFVIFLLLLPGSITAQETDVVTYIIDNDKSWIRVLVYRAGLMSRLGHNHVISNNDVEGFIKCTDQVTDTVANLKFSVESFVVDDLSLRDIEGGVFSAKVTAKDINGTRKNMLSRKLLNAENFAKILIQTTAVSGEPDDLKVAANVNVGGQESSIGFSAKADVSENQLTVSGTAEISHKDLGLKPFSTALGMLKVHQDMTIRFFLIARPLPEQ